MNKYIIFLITLPLHAGGLVSHLVGPVVGREIRQWFAELVEDSADAEIALRALQLELDSMNEREREVNSLKEFKLMIHFRSRAQQAKFLRNWAHSGSRYTAEDFINFDNVALIELLNKKGWVKKNEEKGVESVGLDPYTAWIIRGI